LVNALSRRSHEVNIATINMYKKKLKYKIIAVSNSYQHYVKIKEALQQGNFQQKFNYYELKEDGTLMYKGKIYIPYSSETKNVVLKEMHNVPYVGHLGYQKKIVAVRIQYFWL
jgi:pyruvate formate-lyase activating enzyme-like uncharacterized protein